MQPWFNGPNAGAYTYHNQCGWTGYIWQGKDRRFFRLSDSAQKGGTYKHAGNYDPHTLQTSSSLDTFAGIICVQDDPPGPLDWMITEDQCDGLRQSAWDERFWFAVSRKTVFDKDYPYQCPNGLRWATTAEAAAAFQGPNQGTVYYNKCGWSGGQIYGDGLTRRYFRFVDSHSGATTNAAKDASQGEGFPPVYNLPQLTDFAGLVCIDDHYVADDLNWMDKSDFCGGFRQSSWDPRFYFAVAKQNTWNKDKEYKCPSGYHWASTAEVDEAFPATPSTQVADQYVYHDQCGWAGYHWNGVRRYFFRMSDSKTNNRMMHAGHFEQYRGTTNTGTADFAGIICKKDGPDPYPKAGTLDWMQTDDHCKGFRESGWDSRIAYAVSRQNVWKKTFAYQCPAGYHWGTFAEVQAILNGPNSSYHRYSNQCGWTGSTWQNRNRRFFRFADSASSNRFLDTTHGDPFINTSTNTGEANFAGIVCVRDNPSTDPLDWMSRTDNCGGFKQSPWDPRVYYAVSKKNVWDKGFPYQCPDGFHWMSTAEAQGVFIGPNSGPDYVYYSHCGWTENTWQGLSRQYFRFSDSNSTNAYKLTSGRDPRTIQTTTTTADFAGIVCMKDGPMDPTDWMDKTDNCGGFRKSTAHQDVYFAVSKSTVWDKTREYTCPEGYRWATTAEAQARFTGTPTFSVNSYHNQCGWSGYNWNQAWPLGCSAYTTKGCGSTTQSPTPTFWQVAANPDKYAMGCTECEGYYASPCQSSGTASGPDGKCGGINEVNWRNDKYLSQCFYSPNVFSGNPANLSPNTWGDHCKDGVCCGSPELQNITRTRHHFRFKDSASNNRHKHAGTHENAATETSTSVTEFAGIVCIKN